MAPIDLTETRVSRELLVYLDQCGAGVFVTVQETDGTGPKAGNIPRVRDAPLDAFAPVQPREFGVNDKQDAEKRRYERIARKAAVEQQLAALEKQADAHGTLKRP
jgi:hypothetical protein